MDRAMLQEHLIQAEQHVALGEIHIARQHDVIARPEAVRADTLEANALLVNFKEMQVIHVAHRDRLRMELGGL